MSSWCSQTASTTIVNTILTLYHTWCGCTTVDSVLSTSSLDQNALLFSAANGFSGLWKMKNPSGHTAHLAHFGICAIGRWDIDDPAQKPSYMYVPAFVTTKTNTIKYRFMQFVLSNWLMLVTFTESCSVFTFLCRLLFVLLENCFSNLVAENLSSSHEFLSKICFPS